MRMPALTATAALTNSAISIAGLPRVPRSEVAPALACCQQCEEVCENQGFDSRNCDTCMRHCRWCEEGPGQLPGCELIVCETINGRHYCHCGF